MNKQMSKKATLYFLIASLGVFVAAQQPKSNWEWCKLAAGIALSGLTALKALGSEPDAPAKPTQVVAPPGEPLQTQEQPKNPALAAREEKHLTRTGLPT